MFALRPSAWPPSAQPAVERLPQGRPSAGLPKGGAKPLVEKPASKISRGRIDWIPANAGTARGPALLR